MREQRLHAALIIFPALALEVGAAVAFARPGGVAGDRAFVPCQAQPAQAVEDDLDGFLGIARGIGVLDAQHERAAGVPGVEPVEQRRARAADVQVARGTGGEANADFHGRGISFQIGRGIRPAVTILLPRNEWQARVTAEPGRAVGKVG
jgi:hypothetical protein